MEKRRPATWGLEGSSVLPKLLFLASYISDCIWRSQPSQNPKKQSEETAPSQAYSLDTDLLDNKYYPS